MENKPKKILRIEDNPVDARLIREMLVEAKYGGFEMEQSPRLSSGLALLSRAPFDVVLLDLGLPDLDGFQVLRQVRRFSDVPVIILTVRGDEVDKIRGLELGADDYIVKPFSTGEFLARLKAALRRRQTAETTTGATEKPFIRGTLRIDSHTREVVIGNKSIKLSPSEYELLHELVMNEGRVLSKQMLLEKVWGPNQAGNTEYVDVYIKRLKETLEKEPGHPIRILDEGGKGYKLTA